MNPLAAERSSRGAGAIMEKLFTLREVEAFAAVMRQATVTKAAEALDLSQPAVSKLLAEFQRKAGFEVFRKQRQRLIPTTYGYDPD